MEILISDEMSQLAGISTSELESLLKDEGGDFRKDSTKLFADLVAKKFKAQIDSIKIDRYNLGRKEKAEEIEKEVKPLFSKMGIEAERIDEGLRELSEKLSRVDDPKGEPRTLTEEQIAKLPAFKAALEARTNEVVDKWKKKHETTLHEYEQFKRQTNQKEVAQTVFGSTRSVLEKDGRQPVYGAKGPDEAIKMFWAYHGIDHIKLEDGKPVLLDKEGNVLRDEMSNPVDFSKFVESNWLLGFKEAAGNGSPPHGAGRSSGGNAPIRNVEDFKARIAAAKTPQERAEVLKAQAEALRKPEK